VAKTNDHASNEQLGAWRALQCAHARLLREIAQDLEAEGLPPLSWYDVLSALWEAPERRLKLTEIARGLVMTPSGGSRLVDRMEAAGVIERVACPGDRRVAHVRLTKQGEELLRHMRPVYEQAIAEHFGPALGDDASTIREAMNSVAASAR
jgi:DNA-binding MarR family transcriptional regulator